MSTYNAEYYYCGNCDRQQLPSEGEKCKVCGRTTVSWDRSRETVEEVRKKWKEMRGYFGER